MALWKKLTADQIRKRVFDALGENASFAGQTILGLPASYLDDQVFYQDAPFLKNAPFLSTLIQNPNHIGCHTLGESESFFSGTQELEREVIKICAEEILNGTKNGSDGYVASGGTEANIQAAWIYRNYFMQEFNAEHKEIALICSTDSHYSVAKAANLLGISLAQINVDEKNRNIDPVHLEKIVGNLSDKGVKYYIVIANMMSTMFGSADDPDLYSNALKKRGLKYVIHVDGAYGGFIYPFCHKNHKLDLKNPEITSVTLDAHKMVQAPYGTGVFIIKKGWMGYSYTKEASYVKGLDATLIGSRSGANAVAVWMILMSYGPYGWEEKIMKLIHRTRWLCEQLDELGIPYYRSEGNNIVTIPSKYITEEIAEDYVLVPDDHQNPNWYKIVVMDHVTIDKMTPFIEAIQN